MGSPEPGSCRSRLRGTVTGGCSSTHGEGVETQHDAGSRLGGQRGAELVGAQPREAVAPLHLQLRAELAPLEAVLLGDVSRQPLRRELGGIEPEPLELAIVQRLDDDRLLRLGHALLSVAVHMDGWVPPSSAVITARLASARAAQGLDWRPPRH